jgi:hypothetical protein
MVLVQVNNEMMSEDVGPPHTLNPGAYASVFGAYASVFGDYASVFGPCARGGLRPVGCRRPIY